MNWNSLSGLCATADQATSSSCQGGEQTPGPSRSAQPQERRSVWSNRVTSFCLLCGGHWWEGKLHTTYTHSGRSKQNSHSKWHRIDTHSGSHLPPVRSGTQGGELRIFLAALHNLRNFRPQNTPPGCGVQLHLSLPTARVQLRRRLLPQKPLQESAVLPKDEMWWGPPRHGRSLIWRQECFRSLRRSQWRW